MKRLLISIYVSITLLMISFTGLANTNQYLSPSYDCLPITPDTWQEVDLTYTDTIKGKPYPGEIKLLRPKQWLKDREMDQQGSHVTLSIPEFGINDINATVTGIKDTKLDTSQVDCSKQTSRPVIGIFRRYAPVVNTYTFKDSHGKITKIHATLNHLFYVENKKAFIPIEDVSPTDHLVTQMGKVVYLICSKGQHNHCGKRYNTNGHPMTVYNLAVYRKHIYYVGQNKILVHNAYFVINDSEFDLNANFYPDPPDNYLLDVKRNLVPDTEYKNPLYVIAHGSRNGKLVMSDIHRTKYGNISYKNFIANVKKKIKVSHPPPDCIVAIICRAAKNKLPQKLADNTNLPIYAAEGEVTFYFSKSKQLYGIQNAPGWKIFHPNPPQSFFQKLKIGFGK